MELYRAYAQPDRPDNFRLFGFDVVNDDNLQYSKALKDACKARAGPKPGRPSQCPRCGAPNAPFASRVCYKVGIAGAWNMICLLCQKVHIPMQPGPTDEALEHIETIRARDHQVYLDRKVTKAKQRAKARAKAHKDDSGDEAAVPGEPSMPFGNINNAAEPLDVNTSRAGGAHQKLKLEKLETDIVPWRQVNYYMKGSGSHAGREEKIRTVELVFFAPGQEPRVEHVCVQFGHELFLYEFPYFQNIRGPCAFERFAFDASLWCDLPFTMSPIHLGPQDDVVFIRVMGIRCRGFGRQLARYQRKHGLALRAASGVRATVNIPPPRHQWLVIWGKHNVAPEMHLFNLSEVHALDDEARLALPWAHLIADAPFLLTWRETETAWAAISPCMSSGVFEAPITLVAHPFADVLLGSGEAIAWLEEWRLGGQPRSRATTPTESRAKRSPSPPAPDARARLTLATPSKKVHPHLLRDDKPAGSPSISPTGAPRGNPLPLPPSGTAQVKTPRASYPPSAVPKYQGLIVKDSPAAHAPSARGTKRPASALSNDEVEVVDGPSTAEARHPLAGVGGPSTSYARRPLAKKPRPSARSDDDVEVVESPSAANAHRSPTTKKPRAAATSDDDVAIIDGPCAVHARLHSQKKPRAAATSDDDVVVVEGPSTANVRRHSQKKPRAAATSDDDVVVVKGPSAANVRRRSPKTPRAAPTSDDDVVIVQGPSAANARHRSPKKLRAAGPSDGRTTARAPSQGPRAIRRASAVSDDEVEFVEDGSIVPKRRVSNVNGREVIDLT